MSQDNSEPLSLRLNLALNGIMDNQNINLTLLKLTKRAEQSDPDALVKTFVDTGMLRALLHRKITKSSMDDGEPARRTHSFISRKRAERRVILAFM